MSRPAVIAIFGPTGIGKTAVAIELAGLLRSHGEEPVAVSADALQVYRGLEILTGAADAHEQEALAHRLVGILPVCETFSAGAYRDRAHEEIDGLLAAGATPIVVGGTGLYLVAALSDLPLKPPPAAGVRDRWLAELERSGPESLHRVLAQRAPDAAARIEPADRQRVVRALELLDSGGDPAPGDALWTARMRHPTLLAGLTMDRDDLVERIDRRVDAMLAAGAQDEVRAAAEAGASATARKAIGFADLLEGDSDAMRRRTRQLAKRQLTWMRKLPSDVVVDATGRTARDVAVELAERAGRAPAVR